MEGSLEIIVYFTDGGCTVSEMFIWQEVLPIIYKMWIEFENRGSHFNTIISIPYPGAYHKERYYIAYKISDGIINPFISGLLPI